MATLEKPKYVVFKTIGKTTRYINGAFYPPLSSGRDHWHYNGHSLRVPPACRAFYDRAPAITLRKYAPYIIAEVTAEGNSMKEAISDGFRQARSLCAPHSYIYLFRKPSSQT